MRIIEKEKEEAAIIQAENEAKAEQEANEKRIQQE